MNESSEYRLVLVRHAKVAAPEDLIAPLESIVRQLQRLNADLFAFSGHSPAMREVPVFEGEKSWVPAFISTSAIHWNFGREPGDPTHSIVFFNSYEEDRVAVLRLSFVSGEVEATCPGLMFELRLGTTAAGPRDSGRSKHLITLFTILTDALLPDFGYIELPGHPDPKEYPSRIEAGWLTYFSPSMTPPMPLKSPAILEPLSSGMAVLATPELALETYGDLSSQIGAIRDALTPV